MNLELQRDFWGAKKGDYSPSTVTNVLAGRALPLGHRAGQWFCGPRRWLDARLGIPVAKCLGHVLDPAKKQAIASGVWHVHLSGYEHL